MDAWVVPTQRGLPPPWPPSSSIPRRPTQQHAAPHLQPLPQVVRAAGAVQAVHALQRPAAAAAAARLKQLQRAVQVCDRGGALLRGQVERRGALAHVLAPQ